MNKVILFCFIITSSIYSQVNKSDTLKVKASLSLTGFYQSGNVETIIFRAKSNLSFKPFKKMVFKTTNSYVYQEFGKDKADEDFLSLNFFYLNPDNKFHPFLLGFISTNYRRAIDIRYLTGAGITYKILDTDKKSLKISLSSEYEQTNFNQFLFNRVNYNGSESINTLRGTFWLFAKYKLFKDKIILTHESYIQPSLQDSNNYRWQADLGIDFPIFNFLNFKINYLHTFESIVIANQKQQDKFLTFGLTVKNF